MIKITFLRIHWSILLRLLIKIRIPTETMISMICGCIVFSFFCFRSALFVTSTRLVFTSHLTSFPTYAVLANLYGL